MMPSAPAPASSPAILLIAAFSTGLDVPLLPRLPRDPRDRRVVHPDPPRPGRPRGRLRGQPAQRPRRRPASGSPTRSGTRAASPSRGSRSTTRRRCRAACPAGRSRSGPRAERSWLVRVPLVRRGHFRIEPLQIRTGDPFGFFEASASVGQGVAVVVYPADRAAAAVAPAGGERRGQPRGARADAPDDAARDDRPAVGAGRQLQPDPLAVDGPPRRDPGQGVRARADGRRLDLPRPRPVGPGAAAATSRRSRSRSGSRRPIADKALLENRAVGHDDQRPPPGDPAGRPRRPPAPQGHAAPRRGRRRRHDAARRDARRRPPAASAGA